MCILQTRSVQVQPTAIVLGHYPTVENVDDTSALQCTKTLVHCTVLDHQCTALYLDTGPLHCSGTPVQYTWPPVQCTVLGHWSTALQPKCPALPPPSLPSYNLFTNIYKPLIPPQLLVKLQVNNCAAYITLWRIVHICTVLVHFTVAGDVWGASINTFFV